MNRSSSHQRRTKRRLAFQTLSARRLLAGDTIPSFEFIPEQTVEVGSPLHVPIDAADEEGGVLNVTVEIADPSAVEAILIVGNRSLRLSVADFGDMVFELFEQRAPRPAGRVIELAESGFYDGLIFHRAVDNFVIQSGDPTGTGSSGSELGSFDDQFHPDLQHNQSGVLSYAKTNDDTNNSQFFITEGSPRHLDFNHSIFGQLVEGEAVREAISEVEVINPTTNRPVVDVVIESATIFDDIENSIVMFRALTADASTQATITITDQDGNSSSQTVDITTVGDTANAQPFLDPLPDEILAAVNEDAIFSISATDLEMDDVVYFGAYASEIQGSTGRIDSSTGLVTLTPNPTFVGTIDLQLGVRAADETGLDSDTQLVSIRFIDELDAPSSLALDPDSDTGFSQSDKVTSGPSLSFQADGLTVGANVELIDVDTDEVLASTMVDSTSMTLSLDGLDQRPDGVLNIVARQRVGQVTSESTATESLTLDRIAPAVIDASIVDQVLAGTALSMDLDADETIALWEIFKSPDEMTINEATGQINWQVPLDAAETVSFEVQTTDIAGNLSVKGIELRVGSRYFASKNPADVNRDGSVTAGDALIIVNLLGRSGGQIELPEFEIESLDRTFSYNTNGDLQISALDALLIINTLARDGSSDGSSGSSSGSPAGGESEQVIIEHWFSDPDRDNSDEDDLLGRSRMGIRF